MPALTTRPLNVTRQDIDILDSLKANNDPRYEEFNRLIWEKATAEPDMQPHALQLQRALMGNKGPPTELGAPLGSALGSSLEPSTHYYEGPQINPTNYNAPTTADYLANIAIPPQAMMYSPTSPSTQDPERLYTDPVEDFGAGIGRGAIGTLPSMGMIGAEYLQRRLPESWQSNWDGLAAANRWDAEIGNLLPPDPASKVSPLKDPSVLRNPKWWTSNVGETLPATLLPLGAAIKVGRMVKNLPSLARQLAIGGTVGGIAGPMEATQTYRQVIGEGGTEQEAARASEGMAVGAGILNAIGGTALLSPAAKTRLVNALIGAVVESTTETLEEPWEELMIAAVTGKQFEFDKVLERMAHVAPIAAVIGGLSLIHI